jgi:putative ABC transport system permease protein
LNGENFFIAGRLRETGAYLDRAVFFPAAGDIADPSWLLVRLQKDAYLDFMVNMLETNIERVEVLARPEMLKTINDQLYGLLRGGGLPLAALFVVLGALLVAGAMFALMTQERRREFGLLKAMGAANAFVFKLIVLEAAALAGIGSFLGSLLAAVWLLLSGAGLLDQGSISLSFLGFVLSRMVLVMLLAMAVGVLAALCPAFRARSLEPYAAIRGGE